jgi:hypothetical protein
MIKEFRRQIDPIIGNSIGMLTETQAIKKEQENLLCTVHQRDSGLPGQPFVD